MSKRFNPLEKEREREDARAEEYRNWKNPRGDVFFPLEGKGKTKHEKEANRLQEEIKITNYPKRLKKLNKKLQIIMDEFPEYFV